jgi:hypothetical protein
MFGTKCPAYAIIVMFGKREIRECSTLTINATERLTLSHPRIETETVLNSWNLAIKIIMG